MNLGPASDVDGGLSKRLEQLERQLRVQRVLTVGAAIAVAVLATTGAPLAQGVKSIPDRVTDLEKRLGGVLPDGGPARFVAPFVVVDKAGKVLLEVAHNGAVILGDPASGGLLFGVGRDSGTGFIVLRDGAGRPVVDIGNPKGAPMAVRFLDSKQRVQASFGFDDKNEGGLSIGGEDGGGVHLGVDDSRAGFMTVQRESGKDAVIIGQYRRDYLGVEVLNESLEPAASMFADELGGKFQVRNPQGVAVGGLFAEEGGGGLALTGPSGGNTVVDLGVLLGGGSVQVYPVGGGSAKAGIIASPTQGGVHAYGNDGNAVASLISKLGGSGLLEISNGSTPVVQAGVTVDGVGLVRTGPAFGGPTGILTVPFQIIGHKAR
jgi:hypothetical protein